jgi:glutamate dehydrogenase/leucine dehydrogenase
MKREDIDHLLDLMAAEAAEKGDDAFLPGAISLSADAYARVAVQGSGMVCTKILDGIRYRGVRVNVARAREDKVMNRAEDDGQGEPYFDLELNA